MKIKDLLLLKEEAKQLWASNNYAHAIKKYAKIVSHNRYDGESLFSLGILNLCAGDREEAYNNFNAILSINPNDESVKEFFKIAPKLLNREIVVIRHENFIIVTKKDNEPALPEIARLFEDNLQKILHETNRQGKLIGVEIDNRHHPLAFTHFMFRPLCPKIEISFENCHNGTLIHELSHAVFPTENIFLNEGLALFFQNKFSNEKSWPFDAERFDNLSYSPALYGELIHEYAYNKKYFTTDNLADGTIILYYKAAFDFAQSFISKNGMMRFLDFYDSLSEELGSDYYQYISEFCNDVTTEKMVADARNALEQDSQYQHYAAVFDTLIRDNTKERWLAFIGELENSIDIKLNVIKLLFLCKSRLRYLYWLNNQKEKLFEDFKDEELKNAFLAELEALIINIQAALTLQYNNPELHVMLGEAYAMQIRVQPESERFKYFKLIQNELKVALTLDPHNSKAFCVQGRILLFTPPAFGGGAEKARENFTRSLECDPHNDETVAWDGTAYYMQNEMSNAVKLWKKALEINPYNSHAQKMLRSNAGS